MDQKAIIEFWASEAEESFHVADHLFEKKDYSYALFFGHLAVEKILKAVFVKNKNEAVPRSHNLLRLAKEANIEITEEQEHTLIRITAFNLETRYPDYKKEFRKNAPYSLLHMNLKKSKRSSYG
ncbi:MAG: HEPN domain-containing protein [Proteobacteria bacterium]|nr:HEPN domain-containing protein [Pseudomonadota bacterium]MBU1389218.1 HEPN domain-containing protein [Pseudomonadota bacterium]MBU1544782.1 HEPN domain-containing protein [Pseudomonadota bacterium]MBU2429295.1 HEPN domain-containing protein [Pseudomonadota bacterium]MBU2481886.1 HEPN domain-containing protein [Pseudomonadota bacterium]